MKRLSKILMLVLVVALTLGCVFVIAASAADLPAGVTTTGAYDYTTGYEGFRSDKSNMGVGKLGAVTAPDGNTYAEWTDMTPSANTQEASGADLRDSNLRNINYATFRGTSYYIMEMDIASKTQLPEGFAYRWEASTYNGSYQCTGNGANSGNGQITFFVVSNGKITFNDGTQVVPQEGNDWIHLTFIIKTNVTEKQVEVNGETVTYDDYSKAQMNAYADGKLVYATEKVNNSDMADGTVKRDRFGFLYNIPNVYSNPAGQSIAWDNWYVTKADRTYADAGEAYLGQLFNGEVKNLDDYAGNEVRYNADGYTYPANLANVQVTKTVGTKETVSYYKTLAEAITAACEAKAENVEATLKVKLLNDDGYTKTVTAADGSTSEVALTFPAGTVTRGITIDTNGKVFAEPTVAGVAKAPTIANGVYTYAESIDYTTFYFYTEGTIDEALDGDTDPVKYEDVVAGVAPTAPEMETAYDAETDLFTVFDGWEYFDDEGNSLGTTCPVVTEDLYGAEIYVVAKTKTEAPGFEIGGTKYLASDFTAANVNGKTVKLLANVTVTATLERVKIDLNGYDLTCNTISSNRQATYLYNSNADKAATVYAKNLLLNSTASSLYVGYDATGAKAAGKMTIVMGVASLTSGYNVTLHMYNADVVGTVAGSLYSTLFGQIQGVGTRKAENCNFYLNEYTALVNVNKCEGACNVELTNCNVYFAKGGQIGGGANWKSSPMTESIKVTLANTKVYGAVGASSDHWNYTIDDKSIFGAIPFADGKAVLPEGYVAFPNVTTTTVSFTYTAADGKEVTFAGDYTANYAVIVEPAKTVVNVYDKAYGNDGATANEMNAYVGYVPAFPAIGTYMVGNTMYKPTNNYVLYNANGEAVGTFAIGAEWTQALVDAGVVAAYPEVEVVEVAFVIVGADGALDYKAAYELTAANVNGKTIQLRANVTVSETLSNVTIDLNGYKLTTAATLTGSNCYIYNDAATPATIYLNNVLYGNGNGTWVRVGYKAEGVKAEGRVTIVSTIANISGGNYNGWAEYYNVDFVSTAAMSENSWTSLLGQAAGSPVYNIENCNFYFVEAGNVIHAYNIGGAKVNFKNCNIYFAKGGQIGGLNAARGATHGQVAITLENTKVYGDVVVSSEKWDYTIDANSIFGAIPYTEGHVTLPEGYVALKTAIDVSVSVEGIFEKSYTTAYVIVVAPTANEITVYDKANGDEGTGTKVNAYVGYIPSFPAIGSYGDFELSLPTGNYVLYNANGEIVGKIAIGDVFTQELVDAGAVAAYPEVTKVPAAFVIIGDSWEFKSADEFTAAVVNGKTIQLIADVVVTETLSNVKIDLNGCKLTFATAQLTGGRDCFIYNSNTETSATIYASKPLGGGKDTVTYIGYSDASTKAEGRITVVALTNNLTSAGFRNHARYYNVDFVATAGCNDNTTLLGQIGNSAQVIAESCNFYFTEGGVVAHAWASSNATLTLTNCNVYFAKGGTIVGGNYKSSDGTYGPSYVNLVGTKVYGFVYATHGSDWNFSIDAASTLSGTPFAKGNAGEGNVLVPIAGATAQTITFAYSLADGEAKTFEATLWSSAKMGTQAELDALYATFYRNVSLDVNINFNLYVPVTVGVMDADVVKIGGVDYYVVTYGQAAQNAYGDNWVSVNINGVNYAYNASLVNYVTALNNVQSTDDYVVDSKKLAQYVVYYVKTAAVNADAEAVMPEAVDTILAGFELTAEDKAVTGAIEDVTAITGVTGVTLELGNSVGMVVRIADDFVGTITVSMDGAETVSVTYEAAETDEEKLGKRYIVISNIAAFDFTNDVVITNDAGETMTYNLATYVVRMGTDIGYATYAYAVQAKAYNDVYGAAKVVD